MADKSFGVKELNLLNASGTPTITSPNTLNLNATTVAISTNTTVGNNITVTGNITANGNIVGDNSTNISGISSVTATTYYGSGANLTGISAGISTASSNIQATWDVVNNGASAYRFTGPGQDGAEDNPNVYLVRGQRYRFSVNASGHPFQLRVSNGGSAYTDGVTNNGATSGNVEINVQHDAPAQLYYQCTNHGGMVGNIYIVGGPQVISGVVTATTFSGSGANLTALNASNLGSGTVPTARLGSGTANSSTFLRGDSTFATLPSQVSISNNGNDRIITGGSGVNLNGEANLQFDGTDLYVSDKIKHLGDPDTFIEFETNQINFDTGGSERLRIASGGDTTVCQNGGAFGVGGTPINKFGVTSSGNDFFGLHRSNASTGTGEFNINIESNSQVTFSMDDEGAFSFGTSTDPSAQSGYSEKFRIDANGNIKAGRVASALDFTNSNSGDRFIEIGANQGDALLVTHASGYGVAYFGYERGGDRLVIACDNGGGNNNIDFITDAGTTTGGGTDNLNGKSAKMRLSANGILKIGSGAIGNTNIKGTSGTGNEGIYLQPSDVAQFAVSNGPVMALNRKTSEGRVFEVRYNGSVRGYFDTNGSSLPSDKNYKTDISDLSLGLSFVNKLKPSQFRFKDSESTSPILYGLIAQDVEESLTSEGVSQNSTQMLQYKVIADDDNESDYYLDYGKLTPVLINAVKELSTEIDKLKAEIAALKSS